jgi:hypothetical protein
MAISKVSGSDYTVPPNVKSSGSVNNRGAVARGGSVASGKLTNVGVSRYNSTVFASTVLDNGFADKALSGGTFAYNDKNGVAMRTTSELAGVSNTSLLSGASVPGITRSIHKLEAVRTRKFTTAIRANKYNLYTGTFDSGYPVVADDTGTTGTAGVLVDASNVYKDKAATPTRAAPGQLTYRTGSKVPVTNNDYKAKTG